MKLALNAPRVSTTDFDNYVGLLISGSGPLKSRATVEPVARARSTPAPPEAIAFFLTNMFKDL